MDVRNNMSKVSQTKSTQGVENQFDNNSNSKNGLQEGNQSRFSRMESQRNGIRGSTRENNQFQRNNIKAMNLTEDLNKAA